MINNLFEFPSQTHKLKQLFIEKTVLNTVLKISDIQIKIQLGMANSINT